MPAGTGAAATAMGGGGIGRASPARNRKKRRRRANQQARAAANARGTLTQGQLYQLYGNKHANWTRIKAWLASPALRPGPRSTGDRKRMLRAGWAREFAAFRAEFAAHCGGAGEAAGGRGQAAEAPHIFGDERTRVLFIATVSHALASPLDDEGAHTLWRILAGERLVGAQPPHLA